MKDVHNEGADESKVVGRVSIEPPVQVGGTGAVGAASKAELKPNELKTVAELFAYAYGQQGKQVKIPQATFKALNAGPGIAGADFEVDLSDLEKLASEDHFLAVPPRLLTAIETSNDSFLLRRRLIELLTGAIRHHPAFRSDRVQTLLAGRDTDVDDALQSAGWTCADLTADDFGLPAKSFGASEREKLRTNAITTLALVTAARDDWSTRDLVRRLERNLWRSAAKRPGNRAAKVAVMESTNLDTLGVVSSIFLAEAEEAASAMVAADERAAAAERHVLIANDRAAAAEAIVARHVSELAERSAEIASLQAVIETLRSEIQAERQNRVIDESHHLDDYDTLRTRVARVLDRQIDLLADGLHALRHGRIPIADEYMERSVDTLKKELRQLRDGGE